MTKKRDYTCTVCCIHPGCKEMGVMRYDTKREANEGAERRRKWKCIRHLNPDNTLSYEQRTLRTELLCEQKDHGRYWGRMSGFLSGPGFQAFADDFPPGTKLIVSATVVIPGVVKEDLTDAQRIDKVWGDRQEPV